VAVRSDMSDRLRCGMAADPRLPSPGTQITRRYKDRIIAVTVLPDGFEYEGDRYKSLSAVAKAITGYAWYRELVGDQPGQQLTGCDEFVRLLWQHAEAHPAYAPDDLSDGDYLDEEFTVRSVAPGKLHLETLLGGDEIVLTLPRKACDQSGRQGGATPVAPQAASEAASSKRLAAAESPPAKAPPGDRNEPAPACRRSRCRPYR